MLSQIERVLREIQREIKEINRRTRHLESGENIYSGLWTDYSDISTIVGWGSFSNKKIFYKVLDRLIFVTFDLRGISNATTVTFTLPIAPAMTGMTARVAAGCIDNAGATVFGLMEFGGVSTTVTVFATAAGGAWTAGGTKRAQGQFWYNS